ncbi:UNVERIFIED_CONTAM: hypothetical protein K2H54_044463 [Gekko kuhli]
MDFRLPLTHRSPNSDCLVMAAPDSTVAPLPWSTAPDFPGAGGAEVSLWHQKEEKADWALAFPGQMIGQEGGLGMTRGDLSPVASALGGGLVDQAGPNQQKMPRGANYPSVSQ